jgi:predicted enzyme related to lactoylglutathione lyase
MKKVTGVGGVFFKSKDVAKLKDWYSQHLGFVTTDWGASMVWTDPKTQAKVRTEWSPFKENSDYFAPSTWPFMINYLVEDIKGLVDTLRKEGVTVIGDVSEYDYGKFAHIMDPEGRKIELYQPADGDAPPAWTDKVVGFGGIFFKSDDVATIKEWYKKHLDIDGYLLPMTTWTPLGNNDEFFAETSKPYVFSYRVRDLDHLIGQLKADGIKTSEVLTKPPIGKLAWAIDPDGNKVAFWQPSI